MNTLFDQNVHLNSKYQRTLVSSSLDAPVCFHPAALHDLISVLASADFGACLALAVCWRRGIGRFWEGGRLGILKDVEGKNRRQHQEQADGHDDLDLIGFPLITWNIRIQKSKGVVLKKVKSKSFFSILGRTLGHTQKKKTGRQPLAEEGGGGEPINRMI